MIEPTDHLSDDAIRRGIERRAPGHADRALLDRILLEAEARGQVGGLARRLPRASLSRGSSWALLAAAALLLLAAIAAILLGGGSPPETQRLTASPGPSLAAVPAVVASPSTQPRATPTVSMPPCTPGGGASIVTGSAMPPLVASPPSFDPRVEVGVYGTTTQGTVPPSSYDVWAVVGGGTARRIAVARGAAGLTVADVTTDASTAVIAVARWFGQGAECVDLYAVATDGSGAVRLVDAAIGSHGLDARVSPDGRWLAYGEESSAQASTSIHVRDLGASGAASAGPAVACEGSWAGQLSLRWSPGGRELAAVCDREIVVVDVDGSSRRYVLPSTDAVQALAWSSSSDLLVVMTPSVNSPAPVVTWMLDTTRSPGAAGAFTRRWVSTPPETLVQDGTGSPMSPAAHEMVTQVEVDTSGLFPWHLVDLQTGASRQIADAYATDAALQPGGSADAGRLSIVTSRRLEVIDLATLRATSLGVLPASYVQGLWRLH